MGYPTPIEWCDATWNPVGGCSIESPGCKFCYAQDLAATRLSKHPLYAGTTSLASGRPVFNGVLTAAPGDHPVWTWPVSWKGAKQPLLGPGMPSLIFVGDMSDLFHEDRPLGWVMRVWMAAYRTRHILQLLTKRPDVMLAFVRRWMDVEGGDIEPTLARGPAETRAAHGSGRGQLFADYLDTMGAPPPGCAFPTYDWMEGPRWWPSRPGNVWLGFSAERQQEFDERWPAMRELAALGFTIFCSWEPALGALVLPPDFLALGRRAQVIAGGESGGRLRRARIPPPLSAFRAVRDQCAAAGVAFFFKQWGDWAYAPEHMNFEDALRWVRQRYSEISTGGFSDGLVAYRAGKQQTGRLLDGRTYDGLPGGRHVHRWGEAA
jgi:protein gp37